jgi:hypothetical protein
MLSKLLGSLWGDLRNKGDPDNEKILYNSSFVLVAPGAGVTSILHWIHKDWRSYDISKYPNNCHMVAPCRHDIAHMLSHKY